MDPFYSALSIAWFVGLLVSIYLIYMTWGNAMLVGMFPEGKRWWMPWSRLISLAVFSAVVLYNPFMPRL